MSIKLIVTLVLFLLASAQLHNKKHLQITLLNTVSMNADNQQNIIVGGSNGQIEIISSEKLKTKSTIYKGICKSSIIFIEWLQIKSSKYFVIADSFGRLSVWRKGTWKQIQNIQLNKNIVSVSSRIEKNINDTRIVLNTGDQIIQVSFSPLKVVKRWNTNLQVNIKEVKYAGNDIVALGEDNNIYKHFDNSNELQVMPVFYNSFEFLHILTIDNEFHVIGIANTNLQVNFALSDRSQHITKQITNQKVESFKLSRSRKRNGSQNFIHQQPHFLIELSDNSMQIRSLTQYIQTIKLQKPFISIQFYDDEIIVLDDHQIEVIELDHEAHSQIRYAGIAFLPLSIGIIIFALWKNIQKKQKIQKEKVTNVKEIQLQQMLISNNKKKEHTSF